MASAPLNDFTYYNNRSLGGISDPNDAQAQAALQSIRQYDPNANYRPTYGSDGQLLGYTLDVDASKLPGVNGAGSLGATSGHGSGADFMPSFSTVQQNMHLADPNATFNSPTYGKVTDNGNIVQDDDWIAKWGGPALVAAFGAAFGGLPFLTQGITGSLPGGGFDPGLDITGGFNPQPLTYNDMLPFNPSEADIGLGGAGGVGSGGDLGMFANQPLGSAESSLYGEVAQTHPELALDQTGTIGGLAPSDWNSIIASQPENGFTPAGFAEPNALTQLANSAGLTRLGNALSNPSQLLNTLGRAATALGGGGGAGGGSGGGGGGGLLNLPPSQYNSLLNTIKRFYGGGLLGS